MTLNLFDFVVSYGTIFILCGLYILQSIQISRLNRNLNYLKRITLTHLVNSDPEFQKIMAFIEDKNDLEKKSTH